MCAAKRAEFLFDKALTAALKSFKHGRTMSKQTKKPVKKTPAKTPTKPAAKAASHKKGAASKAKPLAKGKPAAAAPAKKALETKKKPSPAAAKQHPTKPHNKPIPVAKSGKKKKDKKGKEGFEMESDDLLTSDEEIGSEDIPDLSEFEEAEVEETTVVEVEVEEAEEASAEKQNRDDEVLLTDAEGRVYCRVRDCDQISSVEGYCRYHYLLLWKKIQVRRKILVDGKLERYVEELTARYPDKFLEMIRKDLRTEKDFLNAIAELEIDEAANDAEFEDEAQSYVDEMRGITPEAGMSDEEEF